MNRVKNIIRKGFTTIPNALINDDSLTDRARFLFCYMASKPDDWKFYQQPLCRSLGYSIDTLRKYLDELLQSGWITRELIRDEGKFDSFTYDLLPEPCRKNTDTVKSRDGILPTRKKSALLNKDLEQKKTETKKERENTPTQPEIEKLKPTLNERTEAAKAQFPGLDREEYTVMAVMAELEEYFAAYPAMKSNIVTSLKNRAKLPEIAGNGKSVFRAEVEAWVRYNIKNPVFVSDPTTRIATGANSLKSWLSRWDGYADRDKKKDTGVYQAPKNFF